MGMRWVPAHVMLGYWMVVRGGYASCIPPAREVHGTIPLQWDWTAEAWVIGEESPGTQVLWGGRCLHVCCDCLCVIALFHDVMLLVHDWADKLPNKYLGSRIFGKYLSAL